MNAADIMTHVAVTVSDDATVSHVAHVMVDNKIGTVPVVDAAGLIVGIVTEGDLLRRVEIGTERRRSAWLEMMSSNAELAAEYVKSRGRKASEVMTRDVVTVSESTPVSAIVDLMEARRIKCVPVVRDRAVIGIVSRANVIRALRLGPVMPPGSPDDRKIRQVLLAELGRRPWADAAAMNVIVADGVVHLWGIARSPEERQALHVAAENVPGVRGIEDHLASVPALPAI